MEDTIKRAVVQHREGPYAGLCQILGIWDGPVPDTLGPFYWTPNQRAARATLGKVTDRYVLYVELTDMDRVVAQLEAQAASRRPCEAPDFCNVSPTFDLCGACRDAMGGSSV